MKNKFKSKTTLLNMVTTLILQLSMIVSGFVVPKIILSYFGSVVNGLVSSLNQFLNYITLIEGGVSGVVLACLYKPIIDKDDNKISSVLKTSQSFYKRVGIIFILYSVIVGIVYPLVINTEFSLIYVFALTIILSINLLIQYMFCLTIRLFLTADKKIYIISITQIIIVWINIFLTIISVKIYPSIHFLKLLTSFLYLTQPIVYNIYIKKYYKIDKNVPKDDNLLKQRWNGFAINVAAFIHNATDITLLTIFTNLTIVSIYSVYALVTSGIKSVIMSTTDAIIPTVGQAYVSGDNEKLNNKMDLYEYVIFVMVFLIFTVAGLLITPFVMIYTNGISDANYYQPLFGVLLILSEACYLIKFPHLNLAYSANKFKEITIPAFIEAGINIVVSIILINFYGLVGVAIGTLVAMIYRMVFHVYYTKKIIPNRNQSIFYKKLFIFSIATILGLAICVLFIPSATFNLLNWLWHGIVYVLIFAIIYFIISILYFRKELAFFKKYLKI